MNVASKPSEPTLRKKFSILIIQLGGVDEVFRSLMALKAIKHLYPEMSLHVIVRKDVSAPVKRIEWLSSVIETPSFKEGEDPVKKVAVWIDQVIHEQYDILTNWTQSNRYARMAAITATLIPAIIKFGDYLREDLSFGSYDAWSMYRQAWMRTPIEQDIHVIDVITTQLLTALQIHAGDPHPDASSLAVTSKYFFKVVPENHSSTWLARPKNLKWIAVHSRSVGERGSELVAMILKRHPDAGIVMVGETPCDWDTESNPRIINFTGNLHFDSLVQVLSQCVWMISGPGAIVDLASLINLRVLYLNSPQDSHSLKWTESGPYGNGHIALTFGDSFLPEVTYATWSYFFSEWFHKNSFDIKTHFSNLGFADAIDQVQIYRSRIRPGNEGGGVCYENIFATPLNFETWMFRMRGQMARAWFCGWLPNVDLEIAKVKANPELMKRIRVAKDSVKVMSKLCLEGHAQADQLRITSDSIKTPHLMSIEDRDQIEEHGRKLLEIEALMSRVVQVEPELDCFVKWYQQMMHNATGETIGQMAKETMHAFELVNEGLDLIAIYAQKTLELGKPKAVAQAKVIEIQK